MKKRNIEEFDPSAEDSIMNRSLENLFPVDLNDSADTPQKIEYSTPKKIVAYVSSSESVAKDLEKKGDTKILEYEDYLNWRRNKNELLDETKN